MMKRVPKMIINNRYRFKYIQIPYDNRYHIMEYNKGSRSRTNWCPVAKIPCDLRHLVEKFVGLACEEEISRREKQVEQYWKNVEDRDIYLDSLDVLDASREKTKNTPGGIGLV